MAITSPPDEITRSFPEAREFLLTKIVGPDYPVKHLIEQARNKGHITKGKQGRGGGVVTSRDMAMLLAGTLAGDKPQTASDAMGELTAQMPHPHSGERELDVAGLQKGWWNQSVIDVIALLLDTWRHDFEFDFLEMGLTISREPWMHAQLSWNNIPYERDVFISYSKRVEGEQFEKAPTLRHLSASYNGEVLRMAADWLEGREGHH
mgnify:CR=1 FL=1